MNTFLTDVSSIRDFVQIVSGRKENRLSPDIANQGLYQNLPDIHLKNYPLIPLKIGTMSKYCPNINVYLFFENSMNYFFLFGMTIWTLFGCAGSKNHDRKYPLNLHRKMAITQKLLKIFGKFQMFWIPLTKTHTHSQ